MNKYICPSTWFVHLHTHTHTYIFACVCLVTLFSCFHQCLRLYFRILMSKFRQYWFVFLLLHKCVFLIISIWATLESAQSLEEYLTEDWSGEYRFISISTVRFEQKFLDEYVIFLHPATPWHLQPTFCNVQRKNSNWLLEYLYNYFQKY